MAHLNSPEADAPTPDDRALCRQRSASDRLGRGVAGGGGGRSASGRASKPSSCPIPSRARRARSARVHAAIAREVASRNRPFRKPVLILSGGETTVTLRAKGQGRPQQRIPARLRDRHRRLSTASMRWPPTRTASTARKTMPAPSPTARRWRACARRASTPRRCLPATMPGRRSMRSATCSCRGRPARMSTI